MNRRWGERGWKGILGRRHSTIQCREPGSMSLARERARQVCEERRRRSQSLSGPGQGTRSRWLWCGGTS